MKSELQEPTRELVDSYLELFKKDERYYPADQAISNLFRVFPENKKMEDILLKISVINDLYSTNILGTFKMAVHIQNLNIDDALHRGDPDIVNKIAGGHSIHSKKSSRKINFYSFATKYCNWHNSSDYAIYDSFVEKVLLAYKKKDGFYSFRKEDLKDFKMFKEVILGFADFYKLTAYNLKEIDKFLWIYGKEMFPAWYKKSKTSGA
jgi:hypothetical protein